MGESAPFLDEQGGLPPGARLVKKEPVKGGISEDYSRTKLFDLFKEVRRLFSERHGIDYRLLCVLRELDQRETVDGRPFYLAAWLADVFGLGYGAAREKVRTARALGHLPLIDAAFRDGTLSYSKVRALTRVAGPDNEARLLKMSQYASADGLEKQVQRLRQRQRLDDVQQMIRQRSLTYAWDADGSLVVKARLTPEQGAVWLRALEKAEEKAGERPDQKVKNTLDSDEDFKAWQADAMTFALEEGLSGGTQTGTAQDTKRTPQADDRYQVVVHVSAETLCSDSEAPRGKPAVIENGPVLHPETVKRLTCDGALVSMLRNYQGEVLNVGKKTRVIPRAIRRALKARDEHCQYPGCHHHRWVDGHHIVHWSRGGATSLDNLILLCRKHHRYVHEFGLTVQKAANGFRFSVRAGPESP